MKRLSPSIFNSLHIILIFIILNVCIVMALASTTFDEVHIRSFILSVVISYSSIIIWQNILKDSAKQNKIQQNSIHIPTTLTHFKQTIEQWQLSENKNVVIEKAQDINEKFLLPLNHQHQLIKNTYGQNSVDIILNLAQAERLLNRIQSAALDGYMGEARNSYDELRKVIQLLK